MTIVERFLAALLRASRQEQEDYHLKGIDIKLFRQNIAEVTWVENFREQHGEYPSVAALRKQFPSIQLHKVRDSVGAALQPILDDSAYTSVKKVITETQQLLRNGASMSEVLKSFKVGAQQIGDQINTSAQDYDFRSNSIAQNRYYSRFEQRLDGSLYRYDSPWKSINKVLRYIGNEASIVFASRTSIGKTWLIIDWVRHFLQKDIKCLFFSKEMAVNEIADRMECALYKLPYQQFREGSLDAPILARWRKERKLTEGKYKLQIVGEDSLTSSGLQFIQSKVEQYRSEVVVIDGAYLIRPEGFTDKLGQVARFTMISNFAKRLAKSMRCIVITVIQQNRTAEDEKGMAKGGLASLYGSDTWAQDADLVFIVGGQRGSAFRTIELAKGRESQLTDIVVSFKLFPYPSFKEIPATMGESGAIEFKPISKIE